jgi:hypothetical protein
MPYDQVTYLAKWAWAAHQRANQFDVLRSLASEATETQIPAHKQVLTLQL